MDIPSAYEQFGKRKGLPFINSNANIIDFQFSINEFKMNKFEAFTVKIAGRVGQGIMVSSFLIYVPLAAPALASTVAFLTGFGISQFTTVILSEIFFPKSMFSQVSTGSYAFCIFVFLEETRDHAIIAHNYFLLLYTGDDFLKQVGHKYIPYSSLQGMWYKKTI